MKCQICINREAVTLWRPLIGIEEFVEVKYSTQLPLSIPICLTCKHIIRAIPPDYIQTAIVKDIQKFMADKIQPH
jgi:hypothetical protein